MSARRHLLIDPRPSRLGAVMLLLSAILITAPAAPAAESGLAGRPGEQSLKVWYIPPSVIIEGPVARTMIPAFATEIWDIKDRKKISEFISLLEKGEPKEFSEPWARAKINYFDGNTYNIFYIDINNVAVNEQSCRGAVVDKLSLSKFRETLTKSEIIDKLTKKACYENMRNAARDIDESREVMLHADMTQTKSRCSVYKSHLETLSKAAESVRYCDTLFFIPLWEENDDLRMNDPYARIVKEAGIFSKYISQSCK